MPEHTWRVTDLSDLSDGALTAIAAALSDLDGPDITAPEVDLLDLIQAEIGVRAKNRAGRDAVALDKLAKILQNDDCVFVAELRQIVQATGRDVETRRAG